MNYIYYLRVLGHKFQQFLLRAHELTEKQDHQIDHVELFKKTHARDDKFVSPAVADAHAGFCYIFVLFCVYISFTRFP